MRRLLYGGYYDDEFMDDTRLLFECIDTHQLTVICSDMVLKELKVAPKRIRDIFKSIDDVEIYYMNKEFERLSGLYISEGALSNKCLADAVHIAVATIFNASAIVSWNFKHLVNFEKIKQYNVVNLREGYKMINIDQPKKIIASYGYY